MKPDCVEEIPDVLARCAELLRAYIDPKHQFRVQAEQHLQYIELAEAGLRSLVPTTVYHKAKRKKS